MAASLTDLPAARRRALPRHLVQRSGRGRLLPRSPREEAGEVRGPVILAGHGGGHFHIFPNVNIDPWRILPLASASASGVTESWRLYQVDRDAPKTSRTRSATT